MHALWFPLSVTTSDASVLGPKDRKTARIFKAWTARIPILTGSKVHKLFLSYFEPFSVKFLGKI